MNDISRKEKKIRRLLILFVTALILSGVTAFPLVSELKLIQRMNLWLPSVMQDWFRKVSDALFQTNSRYPFMAYGTDWLAFAHIIIALFFYAPYRDPLKYMLILDIGIIACLLVFPLAFFCGSIRGIPFFWQLIDCSFGFTGILLLSFIRKNCLHLRLLHQSITNSHAL
jgi:hypothetical protein